MFELYVFDKLISDSSNLLANEDTAVYGFC